MGALQGALSIACFMAAFATLAALLPELVVLIGVLFLVITLWTQGYLIEEAILNQDYELAGARITNMVMMIFLIFAGTSKGGKTGEGVRQSLFDKMSDAIGGL